MQVVVQCILYICLLLARNAFCILHFMLLSKHRGRKHMLFGILPQKQETWKWFISSSDLASLLDVQLAQGDRALVQSLICQFGQNYNQGLHPTSISGFK